MSQSDVAKKLELSRSYLNSLLKSDKPFGEKAARSIEQKMGMRQNFLDEESAPSAVAVSGWGSLDDIAPDNYATIRPVGVADDAVDMPGAFVSPLAFSSDWLRKNRITNSSSLRSFEVKGDAMEELLKDGDLVLVNLNETDVVEGEVYAIRYGDEVRIRRLLKRFDGGLVIRSDNPKRGQEELSPEQAAHLKVVGRVFWRGGW